MTPEPLRALYRLQLTAAFGFREARALVPYLRELGVSHLYLSPSLQARRGSEHGYDVVDPTRISAELGGEQAFRELCQAGLGVVLDIVPNHMAASEESSYWRDPELRRRFFDLDPETGRHRRFFDVDELAGVRVEDDEVFEETHRLVLGLLEEGLVQGLRIDHPDGLADPAGYLRRLEAAGAAHVWVEKILTPGERLRDWPVEGTTGYEFLNDVVGLFVDPAAEPALSDLYAELTGERRPFRELAFEAKLEQATSTFEPELERLRRRLDLDGLPRALSSFDVYRTYVEPWSGRVAEDDRRAIEAARLPERLRRVLTLEERGHDEFVVGFQQTTGPLMAKGVEDTAFYRYGRLLALNEVGGDPGRFGLALEDFHRANAERAERFPRQLLTTQTHDTKRSADARARLAALTWMPELWAAAVQRWRPLVEELREDAAPSAEEEYFLLQTLAAVWPVEPERLEHYLVKALREAKRSSSWLDPDEHRERQATALATALLAHGPFLDDFVPFVERLAAAAEQIALGQVLLKLTCPGVPDIYQGDELELLALVDPDNRRPVDWQRRREALAELRAGGRPARASRKLFLIARTLALRARRPQPFAGGYEPAPAGAGICSFYRGRREIQVLVAIRPGAVLDVGPGRSDLLEGACPGMALIEL